MLADDDQRVHLLHLTPINGTKPKGALASYIRLGEQQSVHRGYKCSIRTPWYAVPSVYVPDAFVFRQIYDFPRMVLNKAGATATDTIHRMRCKDGDPKAIITNSYSYLTAASAEIEGRSYAAASWSWNRQKRSGCSCRQSSGKRCRLKRAMLSFVRDGSKLSLKKTVA